VKKNDTWVVKTLNLIDTNCTLWKGILSDCYCYLSQRLQVTVHIQLTLNTKELNWWHFCGCSTDRCIVKFSTL